MIIKDKTIDGGKGFDWGRVSSEYAKYRDIYPKIFFQNILDLGLCKDGQKILDLGTGTGVLPRNMYCYGGIWTGTDISEEQIEQAKHLSAGMNIDYKAVATEKIDFPAESFDVITACECFWYFDHESVMPNLYRMLKPGGMFLICNESSGDTDKDEKWTKIIDGMTIYKDVELKAELEQAGFCDVQIHKNKWGWLCVTARK